MTNHVGMSVVIGDLPPLMVQRVLAAAPESVQAAADHDPEGFGAASDANPSH